MTRRFACLMLVLAATPLSAQTVGWRLVPAAIPGRPAGEGALVLRAADRLAGTTGSRGFSTAELVIGCGTSVPDVQGRTLFFRSAEAMEPFGDEGFARLRFDQRRWQRDVFLGLRPESHSARAWAPGAGVLRLGFLGEDGTPYWSSDLLREMLAARTLTVTYRAFGEDRSATFELAGLADALPGLGPCDWSR